MALESQTLALITKLLLAFLLFTTSIKQAHSIGTFFSMGNGLIDDYSSETEPDYETPITIVLPGTFKEQTPTSSPVKPGSRPRLSRSNLGDACDETVGCGSNSQMVCIDETCQCSRPDEMLYDEVNSKCLIRAGEKCKYEITVSEQKRDRKRSRKNPSSYPPFYSEYPEIPDSSDSAEYNDEAEYISSNSNPRQTRPRYEILRCVPNAHCRNEVCTCTGSTIEDSLGRCEKKREFGGNCTLNRECKNQPGVMCTKEGYCGCNPVIATVSLKISNRCVGLPGQPCIQRQCAEDSICSDNICSCTSDFILDKVKQTCKVKFGGSCKNSDDCHSALGCSNGVCSCPLKDHQLFDQVKNKCVSIVSAPCEQDQDCVPHATCQNKYGDEGDPVGSCECSEGFVENGPGFCYGNNGTSCQRSKATGVNVTYSVKSGSPLAQILAVENGATIKESEGIVVAQLRDTCAGNLNCLDSTCSCAPALEIFDENQATCVGLVGALCNLEENNYCQENSECVAINKLNKKTKFGKCACIQGFNVGTKRSCTQAPME